MFLLRLLLPVIRQQLLQLHLFKDRIDHVERRSLARIFVHTDANQFRNVKAQSGRY